MTVVVVVVVVCCAVDAVFERDEMVAPSWGPMTLVRVCVVMAKKQKVVVFNQCPVLSSKCNVRGPARQGNGQGARERSPSRHCSPHNSLPHINLDHRSLQSTAVVL